MGPLQKIPPLAQTCGYATDGGRAALFDSPRAELPHVGALPMASE